MHCFVSRNKQNSNLVGAPPLFLCHVSALCGDLVDRNASKKFEIPRAGVQLYYPKSSRDTRCHSCSDTSAKGFLRGRVTIVRGVD